MPRTKQPGVSVRSTKQEIFDAYEQLTKELEQEDKRESALFPQEVRKDSNKDQRPDQIIGRLGDLRVQLNKNLGEIVDKFVEESERLEAIKSEEAKLKNEIEMMYQIKVHASTLKNIIKLKEQEEQELNSKIQQRRDGWALEQEDQTKKRRREEEEYVYALKMARKLEDDEYKEKRKEIEGRLVLREQEIKSREDEYMALRKQVIELEKKLESDIVRTKKETEQQVRRDLEIAYNLEKKELEGERKVNKLTIDNLQKMITANETEIKDLKQQLTRATQQIKDIAVSVIETKKPVIAVQQKQQES